MLESFDLRASAALGGAPGRSSSFNAALRSSARLRQNSQTQFASRGVLCSSHLAYAPLASAVRSAAQQQLQCAARGASAAQQQLQCGAQEFSQTEAKLADSICKLRRAVLDHVAYAPPPPSAVRQGS